MPESFDLIFAGEKLQLHVSGCLYWPAEKTLVVSDLHLEKGSSFSKRGYFVPPYDSCETLNRLETALQKFDVQQLILLGDTLHDPEAYARLSDECRTQFQKLCATYAVIWIKGNHEKDFVPPNVEPYEAFHVSQLVFRHEALEGAVSGEISGHYHPCASLRHKGKSIRRRCFIYDATRLIMPAFGSFTGSLETEDPAVSRLFKDPVSRVLLGQKSIYTV